MSKWAKTLGDLIFCSKDLNGYTQTYLVKSTSNDSDDNCASREVFLRCGNWCYSGLVKLSFQNAFGMTLKDIPSIVQKLQHQQGNLSYLFQASSNHTSSFTGPLDAFEEARDFLISELSSDKTIHKINNLERTHRWIDSCHVYFELVGNSSHLFPDILFMCSKVHAYSTGLIFNIIYFEGTIYATIQDGEGEQPLIDVNFPDISSEGQGAVLSLYDNEGMPWMKLSIWQVKHFGINLHHEPNQAAVSDISCDDYVQSYCILKTADGNDNREVMFRFGSWCYRGQVDLATNLKLEDLPFLIPALLSQQSKLRFIGDVSCLPLECPHSLALEHCLNVAWIMEKEAAASHSILVSLLSRVANYVSDDDKHWLDKDENYFFEFSCVHSCLLDNVDIIATKSYRPNGVVLTFVYYCGSYYLMMNEANEHPLLDKKFPDISQRGEGYIIHSYPFGLSNWPQLRKMSVWRVGHDERRLSDVREGLLEGCDEDILSTSTSTDSSTSEVSSDEDQQPLSRVVSSALEIIDDAMLGIIDTFDEFTTCLAEQNLDLLEERPRNANKKSSTLSPNPKHSDTSRVKRLGLLERKLDDVKRKTSHTGDVETTLCHDSSKPENHAKTA
ncbi:hypothetical protein HJC23_009621 [Cyclotella cryptica]|uniref:Uncharacterized protein n=1 Tax=Cyclotella cryptica TaxID=29204 RepID=A0ABD3PWL6_9STRA